jgi:hypothetical protein
MITRNQAIVAMQSTAPVFGPEGDELTVVRLHGSSDAVIAIDVDGHRDIYSLNELTPSRDLLRLSERENAKPMTDDEIQTMIDNGWRMD